MAKRIIYTTICDACDGVADAALKVRHRSATIGRKKLDAELCDPCWEKMTEPFHRVGDRVAAAKSRPVLKTAQPV